MAVKDKDLELARLTRDLTNSFARWEFLHEYGGQDPFWPDGVNLDLVRNHILSYKESIRELVEAETEEMSLFGLAYPDIYYRETPMKVPGDYMARPDAIRQRAKEQLALYESDPNFQFCIENHDKVFPKGETKATKEAGLSIWKSCGLTKYRNCIEEDDLVSMRRDFWEPYEDKAPRWAEAAKALRNYLEVEHSPEDDICVSSELEEEDEYWEAESDLEEFEEPAPVKKTSLDAQIQSAASRTQTKEKEVREREEQMSLF